ncbi:MAG: PQQ-dependent sugar dehydrogenase, partial [Gaiellaceae bacterium]
LVPEAFLDLSERVSLAGELGLLGITFSPNGSRLYANYTGGGTRSRLASWAVVGGAIDLGSELQHLVLDSPATSHNGGDIAFGPDGFLYWSFGDGANGATAQNTTTRRGSILRILPTLAGVPAYAVPASNPFFAGVGSPEVWAYGLRNPWRFSFDRGTGDLWIADVGWLSREEINRLPAGSLGGANFGWPALEGTLPGATPPPAGAIPPVYEYTRDVGTSVVGGFVYRGAAIPSLTGLYVFGDFGSGFVKALSLDEASVPKVADLPFSIPNLVSFGEDNAGELYAIAISGGVFKIVPRFAPSTPNVLGPPPEGGSTPSAAPRRLVGVKSATLVSKGRYLKVRLSCSTRAMQACGGKLAIRTSVPQRLLTGQSATLTLASGRFKGLAAGKKRVYKLRLRGQARDLFFGDDAAGRVRLAITVKARDNAGLRRTTSVERRAAVLRR